MVLRIICLLGVLGIIGLWIATALYEPPIIGWHLEQVEYEQAEGKQSAVVDEWMPEYDYSDAPFYAKVFYDYFLAFIAVGILLVAGFIWTLHPYRPIKRQSIGTFPQRIP